MQEIKNLKDNQLEFDLTCFYKDALDPLINIDIVNLSNQIEVFYSKYFETSFQKINIDTLLSFIKEFEYLYEKSYNIHLFSFLLFSKDSANQDIVNLYSKVNVKSGEWGAQFSFIKYKILSIESDILNQLLNDGKMKHYQYFIQDIYKYKNHLLHPEVDKFYIEKHSVTNVNIVNFYDQTLSQIIINYSGKSMNLTQALNEIINLKPQERIDLSILINDALKNKSDIFTFTLNAIIKDKAVNNKWFNYKSSIDAEMLSNNINEIVLTTVENVVSNNYKNISHRYYKLKAKLMNVDKIEYIDRNLPIYNNNTQYSIAEGKEIIITAFEKISPKMVDIVNDLFNQKRVDTVVSKNKRGGAFCTTMKPFVFANYDNKIDDVTTLAHEFGHATQMQLSYNKYGPLLSDSSLIVAEIPSTFAEHLVFDLLCHKIKDKKEKISLLTKRIESSLNTIMRQIAFHKFESEVHNLSKETNLTTNALCEIWIKINKDQLGDAVIVDEKCKFFWSYISHFWHHPFYVHSYSFAELTSCIMFELYQTNYPDFQNKYINFITNMTVKKYEDLMQEFNYDIYDESFWQHGIRYLTKMIDELESLV